MKGPHSPCNVSASPSWSSRDTTTKKGNREGITVPAHRASPSRTAWAASWGRSRSSPPTARTAGRVSHFFIINHP